MLDIQTVLLKHPWAPPLLFDAARQANAAMDMNDWCDVDLNMRSLLRRFYHEVPCLVSLYSCESHYHKRTTLKPQKRSPNFYIRFLADKDGGAFLTAFYTILTQLRPDLVLKHQIRLDLALRSIPHPHAITYSDCAGVFLTLNEPLINFVWDFRANKIKDEDKREFFDWIDIALTQTLQRETT